MMVYCLCGGCGISTDVPEGCSVVCPICHVTVTPTGTTGSIRSVGIGLVAAERATHPGRGFTAEHDAEHVDAALVDAALDYAKFSAVLVRDPTAAELRERRTPSADWPWHSSWWRPSDDPIRNLVKAGALIVAEIDRLSAQQEADGQ